MSRVCQISRKRRCVGNTYCTRGISKKKGGIGLQITGKSKRTFLPNLFQKRFWDSEKKRFVSLKLSASSIRTITKRGLSAVLRKSKQKKS